MKMLVYLVRIIIIARSSKTGPFIQVRNYSTTQVTLEQEKPLQVILGGPPTDGWLC